ncbi:MAG: response regulator transcription factor [Pseudomonadota bacterium]|nr:response regulator transcription factor [Pseudomonadota bacterium]
MFDGIRSGDRVLLLLQKPDRLAALSEEIETLKACAVPPWIVILARTLDAAEIAESFVHGVDGYLLEEISPEALVESLNLVMLGEKVFPSQLVELLTEADWARGRSRVAGEYDAHLSERESEIVNWLVRGAPNKVIAGKMAITEATVKVHIKAILKKVGVHNRTQAAIWAVQRGLLEGVGE